MNLRYMKKIIEGITKTLRVMPIVRRQKGKVCQNIQWKPNILIL